MTSKEIVLKAFAGEKPERVPVALLGGGVWMMHNLKHTFQEMIGNPEKLAEAIIEMNEQVQCDIVYVGSGFNNVQYKALGASVKFGRIGAPEMVAPIVENLSDVKKLYTYLDKLEKDDIIQLIQRTTRIVNQRIGDSHLVATAAFGPFTGAGQLLGVEKLMRSMYRDKDFVKALLEFKVEFLYKLFLPMMNEGYLDCIFLADPTASSNLISKRQFEEFAFPYLVEFIRRVKGFGVKVLLHICGNTSDRLDLFLETGADCTSLDMSVDLKAAKNCFGSRKMCLAGNLTPVHVLERGSADKVREEARADIDEAADGGGFILMPGCDIPPTVPLENIREFVNAARQAYY